MKLKLSEIINAKELLMKFSTQNFSSKTSFKIQRNIRSLDPEWSQFSTEYQRLVEKYGTKITKDDQEYFQVEQKNMEKYNKEIIDLMRQEVDIDIMLISLDELNFDITPGEMMKIDWMIDINSA